VSAAAVANAVGDVVDADGTIIAGARSDGGKWCASENPMRIPPEGGASRGGLNTVLVALMTDALLAKVDANRVAQRAHDGLARAVRPAHTSHDGDTVFCLSAGGKKSDIDIVSELGAETTAQAIRRAVGLVSNA